MIGIVQPDSEAINASGILIDSEQSDAGSQGGIADSASTLLIGFGTLMLMFTIMRMLRKVRRRAARPSADPRETIAQYRAEATAARAPLDSMMADANELAMRLAKLLDAKAERLEILIEQADERLVRLKAANDPMTNQTHEPAPSLRLGVPVEQHVYSLADDGHDAAQIAHELGTSVSEVELILALRHEKATGRHE